MDDGRLKDGRTDGTSVDLHQALTGARELLTLHGLDGWTVGLDNAKTRAGACHFGAQTISLSRPLTRLRSPNQVRDTVLHEIAHALVGPAHGHDAVWRSAALAVGCTATRCLPLDAPKVDGSWIGVCPRGHETTRHKRPERPVSCSSCSSRFDAQSLVAWTWRGVSVRMHPAYVAALVRLSRRTQAAPVLEQLALDALLGGGADHPDVRAHLDPPLTVGTAVRITAPGARAGVEGVVDALGRTRYRVKVANGYLRVPPNLLEAVVATG